MESFVSMRTLSRPFGIVRNATRRFGCVSAASFVDRRYSGSLLLACKRGPERYRIALFVFYRPHTKEEREQDVIRISALLESLAK
ncbi:adenylate cyclase type 2-like isoform X3 [Vespula squamosa]|uniref:Adenylate cyclase type 2-like isoform X3 n=1 Tax=Vespula squamosa TaxID=30214 RepID=A0ABD2BSM9_VESSQ